MKKLRSCFFGLSIAFTGSVSMAQPAPTLVRIAAPQGERQLEVLQVGEGASTVIFESGFTMGWNTWRRVLPGLAPQARLITYSRAGTGKSDAPVGVPTVADRVADLEALIQATQSKPPFVLVGHSYGGLVVRQFASKHPTWVQGLVMVDPASEHVGAAWRALDAARAEREDRTQIERAPQRFKGEFELVMGQLNAGLNPEIGPLPLVPVVLLTSIKQEWPDLLAFGAAGREAWRQAHARWFTQVRNGSHVLTDVSGHFIQMDEPELVVQAVQSVIQRAQAQSQRQERAARQARLAQDLRALKADDANLAAQVKGLLSAESLTESDVNRLGYRLLASGQRAVAVAVFGFNAQTYPQSVNAQDSHGEALLAIGDARAALQRFERALALAASQNASSAQRQALEANRLKAEAAIKP